MKYTTLKTFALMGALFTLATASVHAQSRAAVKANIPFDFAVGDATLKAGQYTVDRVGMEKLVVTSIDGKVTAFALAPKNVERTRNSAPTRLVFHRYGDNYFLAEAWMNGNGNGLYPSKAERRIGREFAKINGKPETTEILARGK
jgi:hypothetical protein